MAVNRAVSSHLYLVGLARTGVPHAANMRLLQWYGSTIVAKYTPGESKGDATRLLE